MKSSNADAHILQGLACSIEGPMLIVEWLDSSAGRVLAASASAQALVRSDFFELPLSEVLVPCSAELQLGSVSD